VIIDSKENFNFENFKNVIFLMLIVLGPPIVLSSKKRSIKFTRNNERQGKILVKEDIRII
jgi:hypothetical protein